LLLFTNKIYQARRRAQALLLTLLEALEKNTKILNYMAKNESCSQIAFILYPPCSIGRIILVKVKDIMIKEVQTIDEGESVEEACRIMGEKRVGSLIVTRQGNPIGIFTERDLLSKIINKKLKLENIKVKDYMSTPLTVIGPEFDLKEAARIMAQLKIRRLPIMKDEKLIGILTSADLTSAIAKAPLDI